MILVRYLSATLAENLISLSGIPSGLVALFGLTNLTILFISWRYILEAGGESRLKEFGKTRFFMVTTLG